MHNLSVNKLVINPTKTSVAYSEIEYLGYVINKDGIRIGDSKIKAIKAIQPPKNKRSLQRLLGLLQYFRKHIPNFSQKTANMRQLLRNDVKFTWTEQCSKELEELKATLISNPILKPLRSDLPVYLTVDAGLDGIGSMLWQVDEAGVPHDTVPVPYNRMSSQLLFGHAISSNHVTCSSLMCCPVVRDLHCELSIVVIRESV